VQVNHNDVVAVVLNDVAPQLTFSMSKIVEAAVQGGFRYSNKSQDFLIPNAVSTVLT